MESSNSSRSDNNVASKSADEEGTTSDERKKLKTQIEQLKSLISRLEHVTISKYGDIKKITNPETNNIPLPNNVPNVDIRIQNELYRYAGLHSSKFVKNEYVFKFIPSKRYEKDNTFAVQLFIQNGTVTLGKWVMPASVDMNNLVSEMEINKLKNITPFLKACKHHVDCYWMRHLQFEALKSIASGIKNCTVHSNLGHTQVHLELFRVQDMTTNAYMNLIIYICYNTLEAKPHKVTIDLNDQGKLKDTTLKQLKSYFKCFRSLDLETAFLEISNSNNTKFKWIKEYGESPVDLTSSSSSDEGMLTSLKRKKRFHNIKKRRRVTFNKKQGIKRQKEVSGVLSILESEKATQLETESSNQIKKSETSKQVKKNIAGNINVSQPMKKLNNPLRIQVTPSSIPVVKLKQLKLHFPLGENAASSRTESLPLYVARSSSPQMRKGSISKISTSTPLHKKTKSRIAHDSASNLDISDITVGDKVTNESDKIIDSPQNDKTKYTNKSTKKTTEHVLQNKPTGAAAKNNIIYHVTRSMKQG